MYSPPQALQTWTGLHWPSGADPSTYGPPSHAQYRCPIIPSCLGHPSGWSHYSSVATWSSRMAGEESSSLDRGSFLAHLFVSPRADKYLTGLPIPATRINLADTAGIRQQLGPSLRWSFMDQHDDVVIGSLASRPLLARSCNYRRCGTATAPYMSPLRNGAPLPPSGPRASDLSLLHHSAGEAPCRELSGNSGGTTKTTCRRLFRRCLPTLPGVGVLASSYYLLLPLPRLLSS